MRESWSSSSWDDDDDDDVGDDNHFYSDYFNDNCDNNDGYSFDDSDVIVRMKL